MLNEEQVKRLIKEELNRNYSLGSPEVPPHQHDGVDNRRINQIDIVPNTRYFANLVSNTSETFTIDAIQGFKQLQFYGYAANNTSAVFTVTIATPAVFTATAHGLIANDTITLTTTGSLPTGLAIATTYYVIAAGLSTNSFEVSASSGGAAINTSGSQSGVHSYQATTTKRAVVTGNVQFGQSNAIGSASTATSSLFSPTNVASKIIQTGNSLFTNATGPAFRVGFSGGTGYGSSTNLVYFVYVVDDTGAVVATATVTAYTNTSITITTTLASGWEITGGYVIT